MKIKTKTYKVIFGKNSYEFVTTEVEVKLREKVLVKKNTVVDPEKIQN